jgi:putative cell wall-binding protein
VYVASGTTFPDALAGAALAGHLGAPVLLSAPTSLPATTADELTRRRPASIWVLGGTSAVSSAVATKLGALIVAP